MTLSATKDILGGPEQDQDFILSIAENLGWKVIRLDGRAKPDLLLLRDAVVPVFLRSKRATLQRRTAMSWFALAGSRPRAWGREDGVEIMRVLGGD